MKTATHSNPCRATVTGATLALAALNILPWRLVAQETKPGPATPAAEAAAPAGSPQPDTREAGRRPGGTAMRERPADGGTVFTDRLKTVIKEASIKAPPTQVAPARFEATVFELRVPEDRVAELDARSLESKAGTAQSLAKALSEFGHSRVLYKVDQTVNLFGEGITLTDDGPMETGSRTSASGDVINSVTYKNVGLRIDISASAPVSDGKRNVPNTQVLLHLAALEDSSVELAPRLRVKSVRTIDLNHSEVPRFGQPCVQLSVSAGTSEPAAQATAYVVRYVFSETRP
jgi:hypothetical protein